MAWRTVLSILLLTTTVAVAASGTEATKAPATKAEKEDIDELANQAQIAKVVAPSLVKVEYNLKYDKGEAPGGSKTEAIKQERPFEVRGFLIAPTIVVSGDQKIHPRFIKSIAVRYGDEVVEASPAGWAGDHTAIMLELAKPLKGAKPLVFDPKAEEPYYFLTYQVYSGVWAIRVRPQTKGLTVSEDGYRGQGGAWYSVVTNAEGKSVGLCMNDELPPDDSWKGNPALKWEVVTSQSMADRIEKLKKVVGKGVLTAALSFRSPKKKGDLFSQYEDRSDDDETEKYVPALVTGPRQVVVLANLKPKITARLEKIVLSRIGADRGDAVQARFAGTLNDYGCFVVELPEAMTGVLGISDLRLSDCRHRLLMSAQIRVRGENRTDYYHHQRIYKYSRGWRRKLYPVISGNSNELFLFDEAMKLVALPLARRQKATAERQYDKDRPQLTAASDLAEVLKDLGANCDASNIPLGEEEESRLAWLGVELQPLNKELARANEASKFSRDGKIGAIVSYVYPKSPAEKAGIKLGDILLRLNVEGHLKPLEVKINQHYGSRLFPGAWERYDELPEQYFDQIPTPWPPAENRFTRALTDLGFGKTFTAEFFRDGNTFRKEFEVVQSPQHYDTAAKFKSEALGMTVKDLTYELRRYFQKGEDDPGLIASKIEPGSKASVSGIKPYEMVTEVNGEPVMNVKDFERLTEGQEQLRLLVKRMADGRVVTIRLKSAKAESHQATTEPAAP